MISVIAVKGLFYGAFGTGFQALVQLATLVVLARLLTPADFGIAGAALLVANLASLFSQFGVAPALVQRSTLSSKHIKSAFSISMILGAFFTAAVWVSSDAIARFFEMDSLKEILQWYSLLFLVRGVSVTSEALAQRELKFKFLALTDMASYALGYGVVAIVLAANGFGVWSLVAAHLGHALLKSCVLLFFFRHEIAFLPSVDASLELARFGAGQTLARLANYGASEGDKAVVGKYIGADALGEYGRAYQLMLMPTVLLGQIIDKVLFPTMSSIQGHTKRLRANFRRGLTLITLVNVPVGAVVAVAAEPLVRVILGGGWGGVTPILQIMAMGLLFRGGAKISDTLAKAAGAVYGRALIQWIYALAVVGGSILMVKYGSVAVAGVVVVAGGIQALLMIQLGKSLSGLGWRSVIAAHIPGFLIGAVVGIVALGILQFCDETGIKDIAALLMTLLVSCAVYLCAVLYGKGRLIGQDGEWIFGHVATAISDRGSH